MIIGVGLHRIDQCDIIHMFCHMRKKVADPSSGLAMLSKGIGACHQFVFAAVKNVCVSSRFDGFANRVRHGHPIQALQGGFVVESVDLGWPTHHEQKDD